MVLGPFGFCGIEFRPPTAQLILSSASMRPGAVSQWFRAIGV